MSGDEGRKGRRLSGDEHSLWQGVTRSIAPLRKRAAKPDPDPDIEAPPPRRPAVRKSQPVTMIAAPKPVPGPAGLDRRLKQKISRGSQKIEARLDLHGMRQGEAHDALLRFLRGVQDKGKTLVLVITGKGARDTGERGVLRRMVPMWLGLADFRELVVGFGEAGVAHGGEGALYVRVRKKRN